MKSKTYDQTHLLAFLFIVFCFAKLALVKQIPLINDEAYTLTISRYFSLSYFDHPPFMMWISYFLHFFEIVELYIFRIPHILFGILTSFFLYKITSIICSKEAGIVSAVLYFVSPFFFLSGGLFIVPDASLNFSIAAATYIGIRLIFNNENSIFLWVGLGLLLSLAFLSKYQAYLFGITLFVSFIIWKRTVVFTKKFNIALLISTFGLIPVFLWNIDNNFDSFTFHGNRSSFSFDFFHILKSLFAQLFLLLPTTGFLIILSLLKNKNFISKYDKFLALLSLPIIIIFNILIIISNNSFAHWSMVGWMLLIPLASKHLVSMRSFRRQIIVLKIFSIFITVFVISIILIHAKTGFITKSYEAKFPKWDNTRELLDWEHIAYNLNENLPQKELDSLVTLNWFDSGQLSFALDYKHSVGVIGPNSNHFKYISYKEKNSITLIDVRITNDNSHNNLTKNISAYGYKTIKRIELPFFRGNQKYGIIDILSLKKISKN